VNRVEAGEQLESGELELCICALRRGLVICYPTETFYGLGIDPDIEAARERVYALKGRDARKDLPLIASDVAMVAAFCDVSDARFEPLARRFWPGPLTLILPRRAGGGSLAIRVSSHPLARQLAAALGKPIVSTSANRTSLAPVTDPSALAPELLDGIQILVDAGRCSGGRPSTIVSLVNGEARVQREGAIASADIMRLL
jgi:L-threonylcarbamoyladenylate synthase